LPHVSIPFGENLTAGDAGQSTATDAKGAGPSKKTCTADLSTESGENAGIMRAVKHMHFARITIDPRRMGGVPCIRNLRIPVATVVDMVADGMGNTEILQNYPDLDADDIREALQFAAEAVRERELPLLSNGRGF
jgi:uncharacterized protein (DUF433 family)